MKAITLAVLLLSAGCGKKAAPTEQGTGVAVDVAGVNALVPAPLKDKIVFEQRVVEHGFPEWPNTTLSVAVPKGWKHPETAFAALFEANDPALGNGTQMLVTTECGGPCEAKDWA